MWLVFGFIGSVFCALENLRKRFRKSLFRVEIKPWDDCVNFLRPDFIYEFSEVYNLKSLAAVKTPNFRCNWELWGFSDLHCLNLSFIFFPLFTPNFAIQFGRISTLIYWSISACVYACDELYSMLFILMKIYCSKVKSRQFPRRRSMRKGCCFPSSFFLPSSIWKTLLLRNMNIVRNQ